MENKGQSLGAIPKGMKMDSESHDRGGGSATNGNKFVPLWDTNGSNQRQEQGLRNRPPTTATDYTDVTVYSHDFPHFSPDDETSKRGKTDKTDQTNQEVARPIGAKHQSLPQSRYGENMTELTSTQKRAPMKRQEQFTQKQVALLTDELEPNAGVDNIRRENHTNDNRNVRGQTQNDYEHNTQQIPEEVSYAARNNPADLMSALAVTMRDMLLTFQDSIQSINNKIGNLENSVTAPRDPPVTNGRQSTSRERTTEQTQQTEPDNRPDNRSEAYFQPTVGIRKNEMPIHKWGVRFDGTPKTMSVESFIFRIETLQRKSGISNDQLFSQFHTLVSGPAEMWYWQFLQENERDEGLNYFDLKAELLKQFKDNKRDHEILRAIMDRRQQPHETFDTFYSDVRSLALQMTNRPHELDLVDILRQNVKDRVATLIFGCSIKSIQDLREECRRAERHLTVREQKFRRNITEIDDEQLANRARSGQREDKEDDYEEIAALHRTNRQALNIRTNKTNVIQNTATTSPACPSSFHTLTCFSCGQGNISFNCSACQENLRVGGVSGNNAPKTHPIPETQKNPDTTES